MLGNLSAHSIAASAQELETMGEQENLIQAEEILADLETEMKSLSQALRKRTS